MAALVLFVVQNTTTVTVQWLFLDFEWAVWWLVVLTVALTLVGERLGRFAVRRRATGRPPDHG